MQAARDLFQPGREIDRGPDAGEVEPVAAADVAVENLSDMQREPEAESLDRLPERIAHRLDAGAGFARGLEHARTDLLNAAVLIRDRTHCEQPVAHEFQNLAAVIPDCRNLAVEIAVENIDHRLG